jgi:hypothetical protein
MSIYLTLKEPVFGKKYQQFLSVQRFHEEIRPFSAKVVLSFFSFINNCIQWGFILASSTVFTPSATFFNP